MEECQTTFEELCTYLVDAQLQTRLVEGEMMYLYLAISPIAVSSTFVQEDKGTQKPMYYTSRLLKDMETCYPRMEKVVYALLISS